MPTKPQTWRFTVGAGYRQFYVMDAQVRDDTGRDDFWTLQAMDDRLATAEHTLGIGTASEADLAVVVEIHATAPTEGFESWDHVTEASLEFVSGRLVLCGCPDPEPVGEVPVTPGTYLARVFYGGLDSDERGQPGEHYRIALWPGTRQRSRVLKRFGNQSPAHLPDAASAASFVEAMRVMDVNMRKSLIDAAGSNQADPGLVLSLSPLLEPLKEGRSGFSFAMDAALAGDSSDMVLLNAMIGLAVEETDAATAMPLLLRALGHLHPSVRALAIHKLSKLGSEASDAAPVLEDIVAREKDELLRSAAAEALRRIREKGERNGPGDD